MERTKQDEHVQSHLSLKIIAIRLMTHLKRKINELEHHVIMMKTGIKELPTYINTFCKLISQKTSLDNFTSQVHKVMGQDVIARSVRIIL